MKSEVITQALFICGRNTGMQFKTIYLLWIFVCIFFCRDIILTLLTIGIFRLATMFEKYRILTNSAALSNSTASLIIPPDFFAFKIYSCLSNCPALRV